MVNLYPRSIAAPNADIVAAIPNISTPVMDPVIPATVAPAVLIALPIASAVEAVITGVVASAAMIAIPSTTPTFEATSGNLIFSCSPFVGCKLFTLGSCCGDGAGVTVHGIKLGSSATFAGGGGEVGGGVGFAIKTGIGAGLGAGAGFGAGGGGGGGVALTVGLGPGAADALFILRSDPPPSKRAKMRMRVICLWFPFKEIPNDYGQKYFF